MSAAGPRASDVYAAIRERLAQALHCAVEPKPRRTVQGGCINESFRWESEAGPLFVKLAPAAQRPMLEAESEGLAELSRAGAVRVPRVRAVGAVEGTAFLALEWIDLAGPASAAGERLGEQLARLHRTVADRFGWHRDNTIGSTPQINTPCESWPVFFRDRRLRYQLDLAARNGYGGRLQERGAELLEHLDEWFEDHEPQPSLLHGDLWSGNAAVDTSGMPVIFEPAVYYGDREADLAMTRLFGGFGAAFYSAYESAWPLPRTARRRVDLYNLYHILNHLNLFGGAYESQSEAMIERLLRSR